jgi:hypothetical protein
MPVVRWDSGCVLTERYITTPSLPDDPMPDWPEVVGWRGMLMRVEHTGFTLDHLTPADEFGAIVASHSSSPWWVLDDWLREYEHLGQIGQVVAGWHGLSGGFIPVPGCIRLRFRDGWECEFWTSSVQFD